MILLRAWLAGNCENALAIRRYDEDDVRVTRGGVGDSIMHMRVAPVVWGSGAGEEWRRTAGAERMQRMV
jgi:hypothetical protein